MTDSVYPYSIDEMFSAMGVGSLDKALSNNIYGINILQNPGMYKSNKDQQGYTFMTRPQLNLQKDNLRNYRELYPLLNEDPNSLAKAIRILLDPRVGVGYKYRLNGKDFTMPASYSAVVDPFNCFIPLITNNIVNISGWPDLVMDTSASEPGLHKQVFVLPNGIVQNYGDYDLSLTLQNISGDPSSVLFHAWLHYMGAIKMGKMLPYHDHIVKDRLDFTTRIYRVVLDERKRNVTKIFACIAGFPTSAPTSMFADYNRETPFSEQTKEFNIRLKCMGFVAYDPLLIRHFNKTVSMFKLEMEDGLREYSMTLLDHGRYRENNHRAYPRINPDTMAMEWWVDGSGEGSETESVDTGESSYV